MAKADETDAGYGSAGVCILWRSWIQVAKAGVMLNTSRAVSMQVTTSNTGTVNIVIIHGFGGEQQNCTS